MVLGSCYSEELTWFRLLPVTDPDRVHLRSTNHLIIRGATGTALSGADFQHFVEGLQLQ